jgi:arylsulfatase A-like enzyme
MRTIFFDLDTLRYDHLGCYGYGRNTSPNIDKIAKNGLRLDNYYCPNAPCLPSRASLFTGKLGIINGIVGHGGSAADLRIDGAARGFKSSVGYAGLFNMFRKAGQHAVSFSSFAERHSAYWYCAGFNEIYNSGKCGMDTSDDVLPSVIDWLDRNEKKDDWFIHVNLWDAHTPYRTPDSYENQFGKEPLPHDWIDEGVFKEHMNHIGPHGAQEIYMWHDIFDPAYPKHLGKLNNLEDVKFFVDMYDTSIKYMDMQIGKILDKIDRLYGFENVNIIVSADHGENMGELGIYGEHATADEPDCHIPMIIKWQGGKKDVSDKQFWQNVDLLPTVCELLNCPLPKVKLDGKSFARLVFGEECEGYDGLVLTQCAHVVQRSARWGDYLYIRTYHGGFHVFPEEMLFNIKKDKFEQHNIATENTDICAEGAKIILDWQQYHLMKHGLQIDPLNTVLHEQGPCHSWGALEKYKERLKETGREFGVNLLEKMYQEKTGK